MSKPTSELHSQYRGHFELSREVVYLNAAYMGPMPLRAAQSGIAAIEKRSRRYWQTSATEFFDASEDLRAEVAKLWNARADNIALVPSVSYGVETAAKNIHLAEGDEILIPAEDFPSNVYPWMEVAKKTGAKLITVPRPADFNWAQAMSEAMTDRTKLVSAPVSDWSDGTHFDLVQIEKACRARGAALIVDVSQSFGAVPFDVTKIDPDFVVSVGYKWQLGPYGLAYLYVANRWLNGTPLENNWITRSGSEDFSRLVEYKDAYQQGARRFDAGERTQFHLTPMALESLRLLSEISVPQIHAHVKSLTETLHSGLRDLRFEIAPREASCGHMIGARHERLANMATLAARLKTKNVFVSARGSALRISPHLYNDTEDVTRFLSTLEGELRGWVAER
jgi:selenocysteine lyase/cysteine desulfurase